MQFEVVVTQFPQFPPMVNGYTSSFRLTNNLVPNVSLHGLLASFRHVKFWHFIMTWNKKQAIKEKISIITYNSLKQQISKCLITCLITRRKVASSQFKSIQNKIEPNQDCSDSLFIPKIVKYSGLLPHLKWFFSKIMFLVVNR